MGESTDRIRRLSAGGVPESPHDLGGRMGEPLGLRPVGEPRWTPPQPAGLSATLRHHLPPVQWGHVELVEQLEAIVRDLAATDPVSDIDPEYGHWVCMVCPEDEVGQPGGDAVSADSERRRALTAISDRANDLTNDVVLTMGRFAEALDLLALWAERYPDDLQARASLNLIKRVEDGCG